MIGLGQMVFLRKSQSWAAFATVTLTGAPSLPSIRTGVQGQLIPQISSSSDFRAGPLAFGAHSCMSCLRSCLCPSPFSKAIHTGPELEEEPGILAQGCRLERAFCQSQYFASRHCPSDALYPVEQRTLWKAF